MTTERPPRTRTDPPGNAAATPLKRIPLPALPHFRSRETTPRAARATAIGPGATADGRPVSTPESEPAVATEPGGLQHQVSGLEMSELLGPDHEGGIAPVIEPRAPQRTGTTGAVIMNDLVDEIEKGLEKELARAPVDMMTQGYRQVLACAYLRPGNQEGRKDE